MSRKECVSLDWGCEVCCVVWERWDEHEDEESEEEVEGWPALCYRDEQRDAPLASCGG